MQTNVPTNRKLDNLENVEIKRVYLSCPSLDFNDLCIKIQVRQCFIQRPGLHDIGLLFMVDRLPESGTKNALEYECLHEAWKTAQ